MAGAPASAASVCAPAGSGARGRAGRWLAPSLTDCLFAALLTWLFLTGSGWDSLLADGDTGWHIRTGEYILANGTVPDRDLFSFSKAGEPWFAWEWGADLLFALVHRPWGLKGVVLLSGVTIALALVLLFRFSLWAGSSALPALTCTLLAAGAGSVHYLARPHVFTLVLVPLSCWIIERDRRRRSPLVWILVPLAALWANLHGGFLALLVSLGLAAASSLLEALFAGAGRRSSSLASCRRYALLLAATAAATLANPYGFQLHRHIAGFLSSGWIREAVDEFRSPQFRSESMLQFELLLAGGLMTSGILLAGRRFGRALPVLFWAHAALSSVRHVPVFAAICAPVLACELTRWWDASVAGKPDSSTFRALNSLSRDMSAGFRRASVWPAVLVAALVCIGPPIRWPRDFPALKFPAAMAERRREVLTAGPLFTSDEWADYLIYRFYPRQKVFFDGRSDFYGPEIGNQYMRVAAGRPGWKSVLAKYCIHTVLAPRDWPLAGLLPGTPGWRMVGEDRQAVLFEYTGRCASPGLKNPSRAAE